jgi:hypothetical protein
MKYTRVYLVWTHTGHGIGAQPVKGNTVQQARKRFKKRFPKLPVHGVDWVKDGKTFTAPI